jgi:hypothetical protein
MAGCPNCGRRTLRTKDWVCQWCGYPLLYGNYKPIEKTYKELQEERNPSYRSEEPETEPEYEPEAEPEPEPEAESKPEPKWKLRRPPKPAYKPKPQPEAEPAPRPAPRQEPQPAPRPVAQPRPQPIPQPRPELAPQPSPELLPRSRPEPVLLPKAEPAPQPEQRPVAPSRPEPPPAPQPEPLSLPSLNSITNGTQLTIDQIDAMFRADNVGTSAALKDKTLVIKGIVNKVFIRDHLDVRYLILTGARKVVWSARCSFDKESATQMSRLTEGQAVALSAKYDGYSKNIIFKDCTLVGSS